MFRLSQFFKKLLTPAIVGIESSKRRRRSYKKQTSTRAGKPKHRLHKFHFGTFSPIKPIRGGA